MFIAKNNDLIILAKETREELEQALQFMVYTSIEETDIEYTMYGGEYLTPEELETAQKQRRKLEIKNKIKELNEYSMDYMRIGDKAGLDIINNIISGLEVELTN